MKLLLPVIAAIMLVSCSKRDVTPIELDEREWMRTRDKGIVAFVDFYTGNYIVETYNGFSVVEAWGGTGPREYDQQYAYFDRRGVQTIYNRTGHYFTEGRIVDSWLTWSEAMYVLEELSYDGY